MLEKGKLMVREFFFWKNAPFFKHIISDLVCLVRKKKLVV